MPDESGPDRHTAVVPLDATPARPSAAAPQHPLRDEDSTQGASALREDIEQTRDRMSHTLDRIEDRIVRRRDEMWSKATLQEVRETIGRDPWRSLLMAFAAGYVLAALRD